MVNAPWLQQEQRFSLCTFTLTSRDPRQSMARRQVPRSHHLCVLRQTSSCDPSMLHRLNQSACWLVRGVFLIDLNNGKYCRRCSVWCSLGERLKQKDSESIRKVKQIHWAGRFFACQYRVSGYSQANIVKWWLFRSNASSEWTQLATQRQWLGYWKLSII